eukprot:CAMPEP_0196824890 /NCGR_PEP_ID=MMETSP1362-20130617/92746_1 /TAXON_ID=163516 /ORGANISM="Leptocylindrus danicus, Strain CCMP1856" /LENGTH=151 /DNA_ID=CAMNT_0042205249 /DNA_START=40 /DNA_END=496 /DNA_ORIENTATION=+
MTHTLPSSSSSSSIEINGVGHNSLILQALPEEGPLTVTDEMSEFYSELMELNTDVLTGSHELAFAAKMSDPDTMKFEKARFEPGWDEFEQDGDFELKELIEQDARDMIEYDLVPEGATIFLSTMNNWSAMTLNYATSDSDMLKIKDSIFEQ